MKMLLQPENNQAHRTESKLSDKENGTSLLDVKPGYLVDYCGAIGVGEEGDVKQIEKAIRQLLQKGNVSYVPVRFECLELGIKATRDSDDKVNKDISFFQLVPSFNPALIILLYISGNFEKKLYGNFVMRTIE